MTILYSYISKQFLKIFSFTTVAFAFVVFISELFGRLNYFMSKDADFGSVMLFLLASTPWLALQALPVATLLAVMFSLGDLAKKNEITAIKAAGINLWRIITIFLLMGVCIGAIDLAAREFLIPVTGQYSSKIRREKIDKSDEQIQYEFANIVVSLNDSSRLAIGHLNAREMTMQNIVLEKYDENFYITTLVLAPEGFWQNNNWVFKNGVERDFNTDMWDEKYFSQYDSGIHLKPEELTLKSVSYRNMNTKEFKKYITQLRVFGQTALKERISLNVRYASVFCHVIVMMVGIPFALGLGGKFGKILSFTLALGVAFTYWGLQAITQSLGENYLLSPFMAAWVPNFVFIALGIYLLSKVKK
ncbi:LptF/LptG family permease [Endomicrobium proavitum]|uniref:Permease YjgP/YjgQ family protein n=1 Tax=Endomicrobium proavitum TaxID=1408281 RepID=A0A0G3WGV7_9BACT|nr:LptF/LptG family permease [Endomicrobium proavitum]AKL97906.1 Permease YjgP/YjgQ family protein [Endomicrobium proavitum]